MSHKLANGMKMWKGNGNTATLICALKELEESKRPLKTIVMEHFNGILFHKSGPANKQHTNQSIQGIRLIRFRVGIIVKEALNLRVS